MLLLEKVTLDQGKNVSLDQKVVTIKMFLNSKCCNEHRQGGEGSLG